MAEYIDKPFPPDFRSWTILEQEVWFRCASKTPRTHPNALISAIRASSESGRMIVPYHCNDCGFWHVGNANYEMAKCLACGEFIPVERCQAGNDDKPNYCSPECRDLYREAKRKMRRREKCNGAQN